MEPACPISPVGGSRVIKTQQKVVQNDRLNEKNSNPESKGFYERVEEKKFFRFFLFLGNNAAAEDENQEEASSPKCRESSIL